MIWARRIADRTQRIRSDNRWRTIRDLSTGHPVTTLALDDRRVVSFASNDYLGLSQHAAVISAATTALQRYGTGAGASRIVVGARPVHRELEEAIAAWKGAEAALLFPTGYMANLGVLTSLGADAGSAILSDQSNHASIIDGARLANATVYVYPHVDVAVVAEMAARHASGGDRPLLIVSDTVFSMDGDIAPVDELAEISSRHGALLVLDEAHAVLGPPTPRGDDVVVVGTLSKALGSVGGFVTGTTDIIDLLRNTARSFIFTTAPAPADSAAGLAALGIVRSDEGDELRQRLRANIDRVRPGHPSPIVPVIVGDEHDAVIASEALLERGFLVPAIRPPTVPPGTSRLRVALSAVHTDEQVEGLVAALDALDLELS